MLGVQNDNVFFTVDVSIGIQHDFFGGDEYDGSNKSNQTGVLRMVRLYKSGKMIKLLRSAKACSVCAVLDDLLT